MKVLKLAVLLVFAFVLSASISCSHIDDSGSVANSDDQSNSGVLLAAKQVIAAFNSQDGRKLAVLVHPKKGVRFSPAAYVDVASDVVFSKAQIQTFWSDEKVYTWGYADGTGDPINMMASQYCREYIMNRDFLNPSSVNVNSDRATGNTGNNSASIYPNGIRVEYYIEPAIRDGVSELNWAALRLMFEKSGDIWFLIAVIHDEWST